MESVVFDSQITKRFQAVDAFIGFFEHGSELRLEFGTRTASPRCAIISTHRSGGSTQLARFLLRLVSLR